MWLPRVRTTWKPILPSARTTSCPSAGEGESYRNLLDAHKFKRAYLGVIIFQAQLNRFASALHEGVKGFCLGLATSQARDCSNIVILFVPFNDNGEFAGMLHRAMLPREGKALAMRSRSAFARASLGWPDRRPGPTQFLPITRPVSRRTSKSIRSRDESSGCETSRWERADCRRASRSPSSRLESSAHPESRSRSESSPRNG
jgi:hypothetical protein